MNIVIKRYQKNLLVIVLFFAFIFLISYQITPSAQDQFSNVPNGAEIKALEKYYTWADNGTPVCTFMQDQIISRLISDGSGGAIITWDETNLLYAQKIISDGSTLWTASSARGVRVCNGSNLNQLNPIMCSNGQGGAFIAWEDYRGGQDDIWMQNMEGTTGNYKWPVTGLPISQASFAQIPSDIINIGGTGAILVWIDYRGSSGDIYAQAVDAIGTPSWSINGVPICNSSSLQSSPRLCSDGAGGAIISWEDQRAGNWDIYAQRINSAGVTQWTANGTKICTLPGDQRYPIIYSDGAGGAVIVWGHGTSNQDIYAQRINSAGVTQWTANGTIVTNAAATQFYPAITPDTFGGYIIVWGDTRNGNWDIYAQRINSSGQSCWAVNGIPICNKANQQSDFRICNDGHGGAYITWIDYRTTAADIYAQLINFLGQSQYQQNGTVVCNATNTQGNANIVKDGSDGAIITWADLRNGVDYNLYAQRMKYVDRSGPLAPTISSPTHPNPIGWYNSLDVSIQWTTPLDVSGVFNYLYQYDQSPLTIPSPINNSYTNSNYTNFTLPSDGIWYFHVRANDTWGNLGDTAHYKLNIDRRSPQGSNPDPSNLSFVNNPSPDISITLTDSLSGINVASLQMRVEGSSVSTEWMDPILTGFIGGYSSGETINVEVDAQDNMGNAMPTYAWSFTIDLDPPVASNPRPANLAITIESMPNIALDLTDSLSGIDASSIQMSVNGTPVSPAWNGAIVNWTPSTPFSSGTLLNVQVNAKDNADNSLVPFTWSFRIDYLPPITGRIIYPAYRANVSGMLSIQVVKADDIGGSGVAFAELYDGLPPTKLIGNISGSENYFTWNTVPETPGLHTLYLRVYDYGRNMLQNVTGWPIFIDNTPPAIARISWPHYDANLTGSFTINATAVDNTGGTGIQYVAFYDNGTFKAFDWWAPYRFYLWEPPEGLHNFTIRAYDFAGLMLRNDTGIVIHVDNTPPNIANIIVPVNNSYVDGIVMIQANAADARTGVKNVTFWRDAIGTGTLLGTVKTPGPYNLAWNTSTVGNGARNLYIRVFDFVGYYRDSVNTRVIVDHTPPGITLTSVLPSLSNGLTTITVTNLTADFNANGVRANVSLPLGGWLYPTMTYQGLNRWRGTFIVTQNGVYMIRVNATDKAGHNAYRGPMSITGDISPPGIILTSVSPNPSNGSTTIMVTNTTADFNAFGVQANVSTPSGGWLYPVMNYIGSNNWIGTFTVIEEGLYTVRVNATDKAGNTAYAGPETITAVLWSSDPIQDEWPMFHGALNHTGVAYTSPIIGNRPCWIYNTGGFIQSSPAVVGGCVYIGSNDQKLYCLNSTTGISLWNYTLGGSPQTGPAVAGGRVYVSCHDGKLYCLNATNGNSIWTFATIGLDSIESSPAIADGRVYVGGNDYRIYCLNAITGTQLWNYTTGGYVLSSPAVVGGRVYVGSCDAKVYCLNATTGEQIWTCTTSGTIYSSPAVAGGRIYIGCSNRVFCLNATTGKKIWNYTTGDYIYPSPAVANGRVYIGSDDKKVYCLNATTGEQIWNYPTGFSVVSSPAVADGRVYIGVYTDRQFYCLNATTGTRIWNYTTGGSMYYSSAAVAGGCVYIGCVDRRIYCLPMILDTTPPGISLTSVLPNSSSGLTTITVTNMTADTNAYGIRANVSTPSGNWFYPIMTYIGSNRWIGTFTVTQSGNYMVQINATDWVGNNAYAGPLSIIGDITPPNVNIIAPTNNSYVRGTISITVDALDAHSGVKNVTFWRDGIGVGKGTNLGCATAFPYIINWDTTSVGDNWWSLYVQVFDWAGNFRDSNATCVWVDNTPPNQVSITAPLNNSCIRGTITIQATAVDALSGVKNLTFWRDAIGSGVLLGTFIGEPYIQLWDTKTVSDGPWNLYIQVIDNAGNFQNSNLTLVIVDNTQPVASNEQPINNSVEHLTNMPLIRVGLTDATSGVNVSSIVLQINGIVVITVYDGGNVTHSLSSALPQFIWINITLDAKDIAGNTLPQHYWRFQINLTLPEILGFNPANNTFIDESQPEISATIIGPHSIRPETINLTINGIQVQASWNEPTGKVWNITTFNHGDVIHVYLSAKDTMNNTCNAYWVFYIDLNPPISSDETPMNGIYLNDPMPEIRLTITDSFAGVNGSSIMMRINGTPVSSVWDGTYTSFDAGPYASGTKLDITVDACDNAGNALPTKSWSFFIDTAAPVVNVVVPNIWVIYASGGELNILWTASDYSLCTIIIEYSMNNGSSWQEISGSYSHANDGTELWTLPSVDAALCLVHVHAIDSVGLTSMDQSDNAFLIFNTYPNATIIAPTQGGVLKAGAISNIIWASSMGVSPRSVTIEYSWDNGTKWQPINDDSYSHADDGSEAWYTPFDEFTDCLIRINITDQAFHTVSNYSGLFTLDKNSPSCDIYFAEGKPTFTGGSEQFIIWSSSDLTTVTVKIEYSIDAGGTWQEISEGTYSHLNDGTEPWKIPSVDADECLVRITATDAAGHSTVDITGFFSIIKPTAPSEYWIYIIIAVGAVAGVAITVLYMRSRKPAVSGAIQKPKWIAGMEATFPAEMALPEKIEMIISKGIPLEDIADPEIKQLLETPMGGLSLNVIEKLRQLSIPAGELRQIIMELSTLSPEEQMKFIEDLSQSTGN